MHKHDQDSRHDSSSSSSSTPEPDKPWSRRGEGFARGIRYVACVFAGYLLGVAAGGMSDGPGFWLCAALGLVAIWLVFRKGRQSVSHAAADAVANANARANAAAVNANHITVAGGHVLQGQHPPIEAYDRDAWAGFRSTEHLPVYEVGVDAITGTKLYEVEGVIKRDDHLSPAERSAVVPLEVQRRPDYEL